MVFGEHTNEAREDGRGDIVVILRLGWETEGIQDGQFAILTLEPCGNSVVPWALFSRCKMRDEPYSRSANTILSLALCKNAMATGRSWHGHEDLRRHHRTSGSGAWDKRIQPNQQIRKLTSLCFIMPVSLSWRWKPGTLTNCCFTRAFMQP